VPPSPVPPSPGPSLRSELLSTIIALTGLAAMVWMVASPQQKQTARLWLLRSSSLAMSHTARRAGAASMRNELATGTELYDVPYRLSVWRDQLACRYERAVTR
jgi:hypothetical protein